MANIESNTLLEKLTRINNIKNNIRYTIIDIGGGDYINEESPFSTFPNAIRAIHSDMKNTTYLLEYILFGNDSIESIVKNDRVTYKELIPYITDLRGYKNLLVDNLRVKGIDCTNEEPLESLINKVLDISIANTPDTPPILDSPTNRDTGILLYRFFIDDINFIELVEDEGLYYLDSICLDYNRQTRFIARIGNEYGNIFTNYGTNYSLGNNSNITNIINHGDLSFVYDILDELDSYTKENTQEDNIHIRDDIYKGNRVPGIFIDITFNKIDNEGNEIEMPSGRYLVDTSYIIDRNTMHNTTTWHITSGHGGVYYRHGAMINVYNESIMDEVISSINTVITKQE